jgi:hypothetical protein
MIYESRYWKEPLLKSANIIDATAKIAEASDDQLGLLEYHIMTGFYSIRKLIEAETKISQKSQSLVCKTKRYPLKECHKQEQRYPDRVFNKDLSYFYDFEKASDPNGEISYICNQIVHSFIFLFSIDDRQRTNGVFYCSDFDRKKHCNYISLSEISDVFQTIGSDYPSMVIMGRNGSGDWDIISS